MNTRTVYCIDTSSLIHAWDEGYPPENFPTLWSKVEDLISNGRLCAPEQVREEMEKQEDNLFKWMKSRTSLIVPLDPDQAREATVILQKYEYLTKKGHGIGDIWVIALAKVRQYTVVTQERKTNSTQRPKIPDACADYGIPCISFLQLIIAECWTF